MPNFSTIKAEIFFKNTLTNNKKFDKMKIIGYRLTNTLRKHFL